MSASTHLAGERNAALAYKIVLATLLVSLFFGGATRFDVLAPLLPLFFGLFFIGLYFLRPAVAPLSKLEKICLIGLFAVPLLQLIPVPPVIWTNLGGREYITKMTALIGVREWMPISLTPSRTLSSAFAFTPAVAVYLWARLVSAHRMEKLLYWLIGFAAISGILGVFQLIGGSESAFRLYDISNREGAIGFFSNANHFGVFMAFCAPICAELGLARVRKQNTKSFAPLVMALLVSGFLIVLAIFSFSRAALLASAAALILIFYLVSSEFRLKRRIWLIAASVFIACTAVIFWALANSEVLKTLADTRDVASDGRIALLPVFFQMIVDFMPAGAGFGGFDATYRMYENYREMSPAYLNNAHNDYAQVLIEGGILGAALLLAWMALTGKIILQAYQMASKTEAGKIGFNMFLVIFFALGVIAVHSFADYPLRGAAISVTFAFLLASARGNFGPTARQPV